MIKFIGRFIVRIFVLLFIHDLVGILIYTPVPVSLFLTADLFPDASFSSDSVASNLLFVGTSSSQKC